MKGTPFWTFTKSAVNQCLGRAQLILRYTYWLGLKDMSHMSFAVFHDIPGINMSQYRGRTSLKTERLAEEETRPGTQGCVLFFFAEKSQGFWWIRYSVVELCADLISIFKTFFWVQKLSLFPALYLHFCQKKQGGFLSFHLHHLTLCHAFSARIFPVKNSVKSEQSEDEVCQNQPRFVFFLQKKEHSHQTIC